MAHGKQTRGMGGGKADAKKARHGQEVLGEATGDVRTRLVGNTEFLDAF
jgi:hypothetical protein